MGVNLTTAWLATGGKKHVSYEYFFLPRKYLFLNEETSINPDWDFHESRET